MAEDAVGILFEVAGGGTVGGASGIKIKEQIAAIVSQIEAKGTTKLKFGVDTSKTKTQLSALTQQMNQVTAASTKIAGSTQTTIARISSSYNALKNTVGEINNANRATVSLNKAFNNLAIAKGKFDANPNSKTADVYRAQQIEVQNLTKAINDEVTAKEKLERTRNNADWNNLKYDLNAENQALRENDKELKQVEAQTRQNINTKLQYNKILSQASDYYKKYSGNIQKHYQLNKDWQTFNNKLATDRNFLFSQEARYQLSALQQATREAGADVETFKQKLERLFDAHLSTAVAMVGVHLIQKSLREIYTNVKEIDTAMTELKKVTDLTASAYSNFLDDAATKAQKLGAAISDVVQATANFSRLGFGLEDASTLADASIVYKNVGDGIDNINTSSESLISTIKAFGLEASDAMGIVDRFNETGNKFAISSYGVGQSLQKSSSALATANNTLEESIGLAVGMNATLQDPEKVGTILKTASMYLRAAKTEAEDAGVSTEGMANSVSELRSELLQLTDQKVDIMINDTEFKSTFEIMKELSGVWDSLSDVDTANILELIGGKRNATGIASLLTNFKDAEAAMETASNSAGSALKENEKYLDSIQGKLSLVKATSESLSTNLLNSGLVKFVLDLSNGTLKAADGLAKIHMLLPAIALSIATIKTVGKPKVFSINNIEYLDGFNNVPTAA